MSLSWGSRSAEFMRELWASTTIAGGREGTKLRNQMMRRLLRSAPSQLIYKDEQCGALRELARQQCACEFWWNERKRPDQRDTVGQHRSSPRRRTCLTRSSTSPGAARHEHPRGAQTLARWASISTCGWSTAPSRFVLGCASPGSRCTSSSERTLTRPATIAPFKTSAARFSAS